MKYKINILLKDSLNTTTDLITLSDAIESLVTKNYNVEDSYIIDAMQMMIMRNTGKFILYTECEELFNKIKMFI